MGRGLVYHLFVWFQCILFEEARSQMNNRYCTVTNDVVLKCFSHKKRYYKVRLLHRRRLYCEVSVRAPASHPSCDVWRLRLFQSEKIHTLSSECENSLIMSLTVKKMYVQSDIFRLSPLSLKVTRCLCSLKIWLEEAGPVGWRNPPHNCDVETFTQRVNFTVKEKTSVVQQFNLWNTKYFHIQKYSRVYILFSSLQKPCQTDNFCVYKCNRLA